MPFERRNEGPTPTVTLAGMEGQRDFPGGGLLQGFGIWLVVRGLWLGIDGIGSRFYYFRVLGFGFGVLGLGLRV